MFRVSFDVYLRHGEGPNAVLFATVSTTTLSKAHLCVIGLVKEALRLGGLLNI